MDRLLVNSLTTVGIALSLLLVTGVVQLEPVQASTPPLQGNAKLADLAE
ncbi:hypothetical protein HKCCE4037_08260 [Rhodobacterales bacterium HKCCE4037]|mgnify:CR=1 FL=1|nr:hypothetical protein [Rhodobacterales bacterium HKCCE4037]